MCHGDSSPVSNESCYSCQVLHCWLHVDCNNFIRLCLQQIKAESEHADYYEAVLTLLRHMLSSGMPQPDVCTFTSASECLLASSSGVVPDHQLLAQLQQDIWQPMH